MIRQKFLQSGGFTLSADRDKVIEQLRRSELVALLHPPGRGASLTIATPLLESTINDIQGKESRTSRPFLSTLVVEIDLQTLIDSWRKGVLVLTSAYTEYKTPEARLIPSAPVEIKELENISQADQSTHREVDLPTFSHESLKNKNPLAGLDKKLLCKLLTSIILKIHKNEQVMVDASLLETGEDSKSAVTERMIAIMDYINIAMALRLQNFPQTYPPQNNIMRREMIRFTTLSELPKQPYYVDIIFTHANDTQNATQRLGKNEVERVSENNPLYIMFMNVIFGNTPISYLQDKLNKDEINK